MIGSMRLPLILLSLCAVIAPGTASPRQAAGAAPSSCETCHSRVAADFHPSAHARARLTCVSCHGGDPADMQVTAMAPRNGFRGKPSRREVPRFCATCHADRAMMHQYGQGTHHLEDYQHSVHGKGWLRGDANVAVCTDCHGGHAVLPASDPSSTVFPNNVAATCARCHADAAMMKSYGLSADVFDDYQQSVHAQVLAAGGRQTAPSCATCHGSHTALPPGAKDIPNICGRCHVQTKELVGKSPHQKLFETGHLSCQSCHSYHKVQPATSVNYLAACNACHQRGTHATEVGDRLYALLRDKRARLAQATGEVDAMAARGVAVNHLRARVEEAHTKLVEARRDQHRLDPRLLEEGLMLVDAAADEVGQAKTRFAAQRNVRRVALIPLWGFILTMVALLYLKRKRVEGAEDR